MLLRMVLGVIILLAVGCGSRAWQTTWPDGSVRASGLIDDGHQTGDWQYFHPGGAPQARGAWALDRQVGVWTWWGRDGSQLQRGAYAAGLRDGWWIYRHSGGGLKAVGSYRSDRQDGPWRFTDADGGLRAVGTFRRGARHGLWCFLDPVGVVTATGLFIDGVQVGPWLGFDAAGITTTAHTAPAGWTLLLPKDRIGWPDQWALVGPGERRLIVSIEPDLRPFLTVEADASGTRFVAYGQHGGSLSGAITGDGSKQRWLGVEASGEAREIVVGAAGTGLLAPVVPGATASPAGSGSDAPVPAQQPAGSILDQVAVEIEFAVTALLEQVELGSLIPAAAAPAMQPAPLLAAAVEISPTVVAPDMTALDRDLLRRSLRRYRDGAVDADLAGYRDPGSSRQALRRDLIGHRLTATRFRAADGAVVDLAQHRGRMLVLVVMRGFAGSVDPHCTAQAMALLARAGDFATRDTDLALCYPGAASALPHFLAAARLGDQDLALPLLLDQDLAFVRAVGIERDLAAPTTFIIDRDGVIRYCYQGRDRADRPTVPDVLRQLEQIERGG
jgi:peroxiredoxin/antitoxin component YwqK of YwqJK toxin-antitoxin module